MATGGNEHKFDPSKYEGLGLVEAFSEFVESFEFSYDALCRESPSSQATEAQRTYWRSQDKRKIFLGQKPLEEIHKHDNGDGESGHELRRYGQEIKDQFKLKTSITLAQGTQSVP